MCVHDFLFFHMHHYIVQVSSNPMPAFKVVIHHPWTQQNNTIYPAIVLAKPSAAGAEAFPLSPPVKYKTKTSNAGSITFLNDLSGWQLSSRTVAMRQEQQSGTPGSANRKSCKGGASPALRRVLRALLRCGLLKCTKYTGCRCGSC